MSTDLFTGCTDGVGKAWISSLVGSDLQGSAQGVFQGASGFAVLAAGLWAGFLWGADGRLPLLVSGVVGAVFAVVLLAAATALPARYDDLDVVKRRRAVRRRRPPSSLPCGVRSVIRHSAVRPPIVNVTGCDCVSTLVGQCVENRSLPVVSAVDGIEAAGQPHPHLAFVVADADRRGAVVEVVVDADVRTQVERRRRKLAPSGASTTRPRGRLCRLRGCGTCAGC